MRNMYLLIHVADAIRIFYFILINAVLAIAVFTPGLSIAVFDDEVSFAVRVTFLELVANHHNCMIDIILTFRLCSTSLLTGVIIFDNASEIILYTNRLNRNRYRLILEESH